MKHKALTGKKCRLDGCYLKTRQEGMTDSHQALLHRKLEDVLNVHCGDFLQTSPFLPWHMIGRRHGPFLRGYALSLKGAVCQVESKSSIKTDATISGSKSFPIVEGIITPLVQLEPFIKNLCLRKVKKSLESKNIMKTNIRIRIITRRASQTSSY